MLQLAIVMPVYNEAERIAEVVAQWHAVLDAEAIRCKLLVLNDGSHDGTEVALAPFAGQPWFELINKPNAGHGPTILQGYHHLVSQA